MSSPGRHVVTANEGGFFTVLSGDSGATYIVTVERTCTCKGYFYGGVARIKCKHILAVEKFAAEVLADAPFVVPESAPGLVPAHETMTGVMIGFAAPAVQGSGPGSHHPASDVARSEDAPGRCPELPVELL